MGHDDNGNIDGIDFAAVAANNNMEVIADAGTTLSRQSHFTFNRVYVWVSQALMHDSADERL
ncbi:MAG TPA: hypothetical protein VMD30_11895 [Tepidisphaeraceae bacterium]|nr:hypothetical protein [Tepidisphaeraceae bacterium]